MRHLLLPALVIGAAAVSAHERTSVNSKPFQLASAEEKAPALQIVKSASSNAFVVGTPASYTLTVTNIGGAATTAVTTVTDNVPAGLTIGALPAACTPSGQTVTCTIAAGLATNTPVTFVIPVLPTGAVRVTPMAGTPSALKRTTLRMP